MGTEDPGWAASFTSWAVARRQALVRSAFPVSGDVHEAEDLVQDALVKVAARWGRLSSGNPDAYARRVVVRTYLSWWRRSRREHRADLPQERFDPDASDHVVRRVLLAQALARLTPKQRAVLVLRFYDDLTETETARALNVSVGTVKSQTHAALERLRAAAPELVEDWERDQS
jgi:RNA polymerase sigma-70 factor (sigma-E family)